MSSPPRTGSPTTPSISADGSLIAVDRLDPPGYTLIDPADGHVVEEVTTDHQPGNDSVSFAPSGATLAVAYQGPWDEATGTFGDYGGEPAVQRFEVPGGRAVGSLSGPPGSYHSLAHDGAGRWLAALHVGPDEGREIVVWDIAAGGQPRSLGPGSAFGFLPGTGSLVILGREGTSLAVVDVVTGDVIREIETPGDVVYAGFDIETSARFIALESPVGRRVEVLDLTSGVVRAKLEMPTPTFAKFSADGRMLAVGGNDDLVRIFDTGTFTETQRLAGMPGEPFGLAFSADGSRLVSATTGHVRSWDLSPEGPAALRNFHVAGGFPGRFRVAADESTALVNVYTGNRTALHRVDLTTGEDEEVLTGLRLHTFLHPVVTADLSMVAALDNEYVTNLVDLATGRSRKLGHCEAVLALDRSGRFAALDGQMLCTNFDLAPPLEGPGVPSRIVDLSSRRTVLDLGKTVVGAAAFGPPAAGGLPAIVAIIEGDAGIVSVHDLTTGAKVGSYQPEDGAFPLNLAMSPDGRRLAVSMTNGQLAVVDLATLSHVDNAADAVAWTITAHAGGVQTVSVSKDGWIATGSSAGNVRVWTADGELAADLPVRLDDPPTLNFAPGTNTLYYEDGDGVIRRFTVDPDEAVRLARSLLTRWFTPEECARYFANERCPTFNQ